MAKHAEEAKIGIRNCRRDANEFIKKQQKDKLITEDDEKDIEKDIQKLTDSFIEKIDVLAKEAYVNKLITKEQWDLLLKRYCI